MEVAWHAVNRGILRHRRYDDAIFERDAAHGVRREHRWWYGRQGCNRHPGPFREPALEAIEPVAVTQTKVLVTDALRSREQ